MWGRGDHEGSGTKGRTSIQSMGVRRLFCVEGKAGIWVILLSGLCSRVIWGAVGVNLQSGVVAYQAVHVGVTVVLLIMEGSV